MLALSIQAIIGGFFLFGVIKCVARGDIIEGAAALLVACLFLSAA